MPRHTLDDIEKQKKPKQNFQSLPPQTAIDINEKGIPEGADPEWVRGSILTSIVSSVLWIPFILMDEDYLTRITNLNDLTTLDWLSFLLPLGIMSGFVSTYLTFITSKNPKLVEEWKGWILKKEMRKNNPNPKLVEEWKEWNLKEEMRKNNPNPLSEGEPKDNFGRGRPYLYVMVGSFLGGLFLFFAFFDNPNIAWLGVLISVFGFLMLLFLPLIAPWD